MRGLPINCSRNKLRFIVLIYCAFSLFPIIHQLVNVSVNYLYEDLHHEDIEISLVSFKNNPFICLIIQYIWEFILDGIFNTDIDISVLKMPEYNSFLSSIWGFSFSVYASISTLLGIIGLLLFKSWGRTFFSFSFIASLALNILFENHLLGLDLLFDRLAFLLKGIVLVLIYFTDVSFFVDKNTKAFRPLLYLALPLGLLHLVLMGLQVDDDLVLPAAELLSESNPKGKSNAYYYLLGLKALPDISPLDAGKMVADQLAKADQAYAISGNENDYYKFFDQSAIRSAITDIDLSNGIKVFRCKFIYDDCVELVFSDQYDLTTLMGKNQQLHLQRYQEFLNLDDYQTLHKPNVREPAGLLLALDFGNRLVILKALEMAKKSDAKTAIDFLIRNTILLRKQLEQADQDLLKVYYTFHISNNIDVISYLMFHNQNLPAIILPTLTADEKSFRRPLARELAKILNSIDNSGYGPISSQQYPSIHSVLYKKNMTANDFYNPYLDMIKLSTISPSEFAESIKKWQLNSSNETYSGLSEDSLKPMAGDLFFPVKLKTNRFRNFIGSIYSDSLLFNEANELKSISLVFNLDAKIQLFNQAVTQRYSANFDPQKIKNPYAVNSVAYFSDSKKRLCFDGPFENERNHHTIRCLWVGQNSVAE